MPLWPLHNLFNPLTGFSRKLCGEPFKELSPLNYLVVVDFCFLDVPRGAERVAWDISMAARDQGWNVSMLCLRPSPGDLPGGPALQEGITVVRYEKPELTKWHPMRMRRQIEAAAAAFGQWLRETRWDVVHIHSPVIGAGVLRAAGSRVRYVYTAHSPIALENRINWAAQGWPGKAKLVFGLPALRSLERKLLTRSAAIHTLSEFTRSEINHSHGLGNRVTVIPHWCRDGFRRFSTRLEARRLLGWSADQPIFFTLRRHEERYGIDIAIRAIAPLASSHKWLLYVGGDGLLRPKLEALALELGLSDRVRFTGRLTDEELALAYQAADAFLLPTNSLECFGLIILEALACGCPVIATDAGAIPEIMKAILPDFIVPAGDPIALREKILDFLEHKLQSPPPEELTTFALSKYGKPEIVPMLLGLLRPYHNECAPAVSQAVSNAVEAQEPPNV